MLALLIAPVDALVLGTAMRATTSARTASSTMLWDPTKDDVNDAPLNKEHMLRHTEEVVPLYVAPGPMYQKPDDGCEQVTLDQYASMVFGKNLGKLDAWICAEGDEPSEKDECNYVMHKGEMVWACI